VGGVVVDVLAGVLLQMDAEDANVLLAAVGPDRRADVRS